MTGNQFIDAFLILVAAVFFVGAGVFLPLWELSQNRPFVTRRRPGQQNTAVSK